MVKFKNLNRYVKLLVTLSRLTSSNVACSTFGWSCGFWNAKAKDPQAVKKLGKTVYNKLEIHSKTSPHRLLVTLLGPLIMDPNDGRSRRIYRDGETWI